MFCLVTFLELITDGWMICCRLIDWMVDIIFFKNVIKKKTEIINWSSHTHHTVQSIKLDISRMGKNLILSSSHIPRRRAAGVTIRRIHLTSLALQMPKQANNNIYMYSWKSCVCSIRLGRVCDSWIINILVLTGSIHIIVGQIAVDGPREFQYITPLVFIDYFVLWLLQELGKFWIQVPMLR